MRCLACFATFTGADKLPDARLPEAALLLAWLPVSGTAVAHILYRQGDFGDKFHRRFFPGRDLDCLPAGYHRN